MVDIPRTPSSRRNRNLWVGGAVASAVVAVVSLASMADYAPRVSRDLLIIDVVRRGDLVREVRGAGTLVPEQVRWISALTPARVERIFVRTGTQVEPGTLLLELANPDVQIEALDAQRQLTAATGALVSLRTTLYSARLTQTGAVATARSRHRAALRDAAVAESVAVQGGLSRNEVKLARERAEELGVLHDVEEQRLALLASTIDSQLAVQQAEVDRLRAIAAFRQNRLEALQVRAGDHGVLQELSLQPGQWVVPGTTLAIVVHPGALRAVVRIPETQASGLAIGQQARVDTRNGIVPGHVVRIDPSAQGGTVSVDIALDGPLPSGARPDMNVDAVVVIDRLPDVLSVGLPAFGQPNGVIGMFRLTPDGRHAVRVPVRVGRASVSAMEIRQGLAAGDSVILSATPQLDGVDRVRLN